MTTIVAHWPMLAMLLTPFALAMVATIVSVYGDPDHDPSTPPPWWVLPFVVLQGLLTARAAPGRAGIEGLGDGRWSLPLLHYTPIGEPVPARNGVAPPPLPPAALLALLVGLAALSGCPAAMDAAKTSRSMLAGRLTEAAGAWEKYDVAHYAQISSEEKYREDAQRRVLAYTNGEHAEAVKAFNSAWGILLGIDQELRAVEAGQKRDLGEAIARGYAGLKQIVDVLTKLGVKIPSGVM